MATVRSIRPLTVVQRAFGRDTDDLGQRVVHGALLMFAGVVLRTGITLGSMAVLARLLAPADFGHLAMATVVTEFAALVANFGFASVLIQRPRLARIHLDTVFWAALALGLALSALVFALSFFSTALFGDPVPGALLRVLCLTFVGSQLGVVPFAVMSRLMMFRQDLYVQVLSLACRAGVAMALAWSAFGVWSLVAGSVAGVMAQCLASAFIVGYLPRRKFSAAYLRSTWRVNGSYFGGGILFYLNTNVDLMIVARALGATSLGYYQNARSLTDEIRARIAIPLQRVLFPAFSALQDDLPRFQNGVKRSGKLLSLVVLPIGFGLAGVAEELVPVLYGGQWLGMIPALEIIAAGAGVRAATATAGPIFSATNRVGLSLRLNLVSSALLMLSLAIGTFWGLVGIAVALSSAACYGVVIYGVAFGLIELRARDLGEVLLPPLTACLAMMLILLAIRPVVAGAFAHLGVRLGVMVAVGAIVYAAGMLLCARTHVREVALFAQRLRRQRRPPA